MMNSAILHFFSKSLGFGCFKSEMETKVVHHFRMWKSFENVSQFRHARKKGHFVSAKEFSIRNYFRKISLKIIEK